jgi:hypothetical protein
MSMTENQRVKGLPEESLDKFINFDNKYFLNVGQNRGRNRRN